MISLREVTSIMSIRSWFLGFRISRDQGPLSLIIRIIDNGYDSFSRSYLLPGGTQLGTGLQIHEKDRGQFAEIIFRYSEGCCMGGPLRVARRRRAKLCQKQEGFGISMLRKSRLATVGKPRSRNNGRNGLVSRISPRLSGFRWFRARPQIKTLVACANVLS
jgi:hypothetical protein